LADSTLSLGTEGESPRKKAPVGEAAAATPPDPDEDRPEPPMESSAPKPSAPKPSAPKPSAPKPSAPGPNPPHTEQGLSANRSRLMARLRIRRTREREGLVLLEGPRVVQTALEAGARLRFVLVSEGTAHGPAAVLARLQGVACLEVTEDELRRHADTENPQGVLAVAEEPAPVELSALYAAAAHADPRPTGLPLLVLDALQDPGNMGTLIRTAAAFGAAGVVVLDGSVDPWSPKVVRSSAGEGFRIPIVRMRWAAFDEARRAEGLPLVLADARGEDVRTAALAGGALLVGNEGAGPRAEAVAAADRLVALPLAGGVESLNAAVAGSVLLWMLGPGRPSGATP
jgi:TrmH family RNA methyltransferase